jgi:hypothetical protein
MLAWLDKPGWEGDVFDRFGADLVAGVLVNVQSSAASIFGLELYGFLVRALQPEVEIVRPIPD